MQVLFFRQSSKLENYARNFLPVKNDKAMVAIFGHPKVYPGVVSMMMSDLPLKSKYPMNELRKFLFNHVYATGKVVCGKGQV